MPTLERLVERRLLSATSFTSEPGGEQSLTNPPLAALSQPLWSQPVATRAADSNRLFPGRQRVTDSVLSLVSQAADRQKKESLCPEKSASTQLAQRPPTAKPADCSAGPGPIPLFPQGDPAPPFRLPKSIPLGLFRDGSVRAVHPDIDPHVYRAWQSSQQGPIEQTLHRSTSPYGAPVRMAAGTDPQLLILSGLRPNWQAATGKLLYSKQSIFIPSIKPWLSTGSIYRQLKDFRHFDQDNLAQARVIRAGALDSATLQGRQFALFRVRLLLETKPLETHWALLNTLQTLVNTNPVAVELHYHDKHHMVEAVTIGNHMLAGSRRWCVIKTGDQSVHVTSEAWVRPNGKLNEFAIQSLGPLAMERIWSQYLINIGNAVKLTGSQFVHGPVLHRELTISPSDLRSRLYPWPPVQRPGSRETGNEFFTLPTHRSAPRP
ncbi:MAG: hypothetical protein VB857_01805 [Pirellulaceae bacterium]